MGRVRLSDNHRFRILLWLTTFSIVLGLSLGYFALTASMRLYWLEGVLEDTSSTPNQLQWQVVDSSNQTITDIAGISSLTMPKGWFYTRNNNQAQTGYQSLSLENYSGTHANIIYLTGSYITVDTVKIYDSADEFLTNSQQMYTQKTNMRTVKSFALISLDGYPAYRAEASMTNTTTLGVELTKPSQAIEVAAYVNGRVVEFNLATGSFSSQAEIDSATSVFNNLLSTVKLAH